MATATARFSATTGEEHHSVDLLWWDDLVKTTDGRKLITKGFANLPLSAPGLGIELNEEVVVKNEKKKEISHQINKIAFTSIKETRVIFSFDKIISSK